MHLQKGCLFPIHKLFTQKLSLSRYGILIKLADHFAIQMAHQYVEWVDSFFKMNVNSENCAKICVKGISVQSVSIAIEMAIKTIKLMQNENINQGCASSPLPTIFYFQFKLSNNRIGSCEAEILFS